MRKVILFVCLVCISTGIAIAQNPYEAANFATSDLNGTARFVGMGGALSALGGDISTVSTNPAGTGMFSKSEISLSASAVISGVDGVLGGNTSKASFDQTGIIIAMPTENSALNGMTFGLNISKKKNFFGNVDTDIFGLDGLFSQTHQIADMATDAYLSDCWDGALADMSAPIFDDDDKLVRPGIINEVWLTDDYGFDYMAGYQGIGAKAAHYQRSTYGSIMDIDMNFAINLKNQYFFGATLGVYDVESRRSSKYEELGTDGAYFDFNNYYDTKGSGFDLKLGAIIRPFDYSPFRIGLFIHTPTWYNLEDINGSTLFLNDDYLSGKDYDPYEYKLRTPWKFGISAGTTVGNYFAFGVEYEYQDLSSCKYSERYRSGNEYFRYQNEMMKTVLRGQHTLKLGMEAKPADNVSVRCGYNYVSAPMKSEGYNILGFDGVMTETDYTNWKDTNRFTFGLGFRFNGGYFDLTYQYSTQKGDFYAFQNVYYKGDPGNLLPPTEIKNNRSQILGTLGFRF